MGILNERDALRKSMFGERVDRAAAALPQTTQEALFTIAGGRVLLLGLLGEVTTIIQTQANNTKLIANPTTGSDVDICAALDITADEVGCLYSISGLNTDALIGLNAGAVPGMVRPVILPIGTLDLDCAASNTGAIKWSALWVPWDTGAVLTAA